MDARLLTWRTIPKQIMVPTYYVDIAVKAFLKSKKIQRYHLNVEEDLVPNL